MAEFASKYETLLLRRERSRLYVTLNRPQVKNALNPTLIGELRTVFQNLRDRSDIKVVILRGAGGTFCAGTIPIAVSLMAKPASSVQIATSDTQSRPKPPAMA